VPGHEKLGTHAWVEDAVRLESLVGGLNAGFDIFYGVIGQEVKVLSEPGSIIGNLLLVFASTQWPLT
jgi:hypothetical protein